MADGAEPDAATDEVRVGFDVVIAESDGARASKILIQVKKAPTRHASHHAASPDGDTLATASLDKTVRLWRGIPAAQVEPAGTE